MQWRNREKRNDKDHHEKASFFHLAELQNGCFVLFLGKTSSQEAVARRYSIKKVFLEILLNSQENNVPESAFK